MRLPADWSDVLSPVVVKEVRQGIRAKVFVGAFLITQMLMVFSVFLSLVSDGRDAAGATAFFWTLVGLPLLLIMPARGLHAVGSEIRDDTIDLVFLSRLSAWRIVVGKWAALAAQSVLLVSSLLPYIVLRYFIGSVNLLQDLLALGVMLGFSILLSTGAVGVSAFQPKGKKGGAPVGLIVLGLLALITFGPVVTFGISALVRGSSGTGFYADTYACLAFLGPVLGVFLLQLGASKIAPPAENHALRKRLTAFITVLVALGLSVFDVARPFPYIFACSIAGVTIIDALCERVPRIYSIFLPFARRGVFGRLAGRILYPGWASGVVFGFVMITALFVWAYLHPEFRGEVELFAYVLAIGVVFFPVAIIRSVRPKAERPLPAYFIIHGITAVLTSAAVILSEAADNQVLSAVMSIIPLSYLIIGGIENNALFEQVFTVGGSAVTLLTMLVLFWRIRGSFVDTDALVAEVSRHSEAKHADAIRPVEVMTALPAQELHAAKEISVEVTTATEPPPFPASDSPVAGGEGD
jgi:ABC-type transport system involved in multi-copper enzyme maturation permease subunit